MNDQQLPASGSKAGQAQHGYRNQVNWEGGSGRQPYANRGRTETPGPAAAGDVQDGNRRDRSGVNVEQAEAAKRTA